MRYFFEAFQKFNTFSGRARRSEYWYFYLFNTIIVIVLALIGELIQFPKLGYIYNISTLLPGIAVGIRRMHDIGKSGWFILIPIYNLILLCTEGEKGDNEYGSDPKLEHLKHN